MCSCNANGWIIEDGIVVDRCMKCNEPPWLARQRRQRFISHPLIFIPSFLVAVSVLELLALHIAMWWRS